MQELLAKLKQYRVDVLNTFDIKVSPSKYTVIIELNQSKGEKFVDFSNADIEVALQSAIDYVDKNLLFK